MRTFISIKLPLKILMEIKEIQDRIPEFTGKKTELKNLHLTLKFLGEISPEELEKIKLKLKEIKFSKFEAEIKDLGFFDNSYQGIVWLGITNCENIQKEVDRYLGGLYEKERRFMGHLTIARIKKIFNKKKFLENLKNIQVPKMFFIVDKFYLMESNLKKEGPEYRIIEEYNLS
jgi:RNA 2',3'-cyclic 3'-phosphodiesterase